jgi:hypothetical protein
MSSREEERRRTTRWKSRPAIVHRVAISYRFVSSIYSDDLLTGGVQTELVDGGGVHEVYTRIPEYSDQ